MLDIKLLREEPQQIRDNLVHRNVRPFADIESEDWAQESVDRLVALDTRYRELLQDAEENNRQQNENSQAMRGVGKLPKEEQQAARAPLIARGSELKGQGKELDAQTAAVKAERDAAWARVPNLTHPDSPRGHGDEDHVELRQVGKRRDFEAEGFEARDHLTIAEALDLVDFASAAKVAGQKFYYLKNEAVLLDMALQRYALDVARKHGFVLHTTPDLARHEILDGLGFNPRGESTQVYSIENSDLCLVGTAEITLGGMLADEILDEDRLPLLYAGLSHCFRTEAGSAGQESRGLYRVHQFTKVELFAFTTGEHAESDAMHQRMLAIEEELFTGLGLPFRVLDMAAGDLANPAYRKYDLEAWMPGRGRWGEVTSTSNCTDYQARRLQIRYRPSSPDGKKRKPRTVHMLNGTAVATSRALVAILENNQQSDGSVLVPEALRAHCGFDRIGPRSA
jgi:seryl-tRNA synthetase